VGGNSDSIVIYDDLANSFAREISDGQSIYIRVTDDDGNEHDVRFDLTGTKKMLSKMSEACN